MLNDIQSRVYSRLVNKCPSSLKTKYPDLTFTTSDRVPQNPKFPNVYVHERGSMELARDLQGTTINAIRASFQIEVTDNSNMTNATEIMNYVVGEMKVMRFEIVTMPEFENTPSVYRKVAVFRRVLGDGDTL